MRLTHNKQRTPQEIEKGNEDFLELLRQEITSGKVPKELVRLTKSQIEDDEP